MSSSLDWSINAAATSATAADPAQSRAATPKTSGAASSSSSPPSSAAFLVRLLLAPVRMPLHSQFPQLLKSSASTQASTLTGLGVSSLLPLGLGMSLLTGTEGAAALFAAALSFRMSSRICSFALSSFSYRASPGSSRLVWAWPGVDPTLVRARRSPNPSADTRAKPNPRRAPEGKLTAFAR
eukprot:CAMPEP_0172634292 /NCGR_PEP_ID=MMETSP1068-20121228/193756_1 /TAXON_ID=35684 /ORGANISM="Pseudopedinella elastica, Strain CCMP716" /LENGTH=181 /DNA_ID=CAMNT_0013446213 /DNA_START=222 /DNA_END=767 /DNA_ORIENTATION=-